jgi:hypothetical protein
MRSFLSLEKPEEAGIVHKPDKKSEAAWSN